MRRLLPALLLLAALAAPATTHAYTPGPYGCNLRWSQCFGDGGAINKSFACDTNTGSDVLVGSFVPAWDHGDLTGIDFTMTLASAGSSLPAWWQFKNAGTCRPASLGMNFTNATGAVACRDWAPVGEAAGGIAAYQIGLKGANSARILAAIAVPPSVRGSVSGLQEYFVFNLGINHAKTVGTGACAGCTTPVCIVLDRIRTYSSGPVENRTVMGPSNFTDSDYATWQGGAGVSTFLGSGCPAATPTKRETWSEVKSLYR